MKVIQINASYKPAYIYGGPALSVSRLCEGLVKAGTELEVLTTTANGKAELKVKLNEPVDIDNVKVTYFKRITKDHTHFSPTLLWSLNRKLKDYNNLAKLDENRKDEGFQKLIIHIHVWWNLVSVFSCLIAQLYKIPVILTPRGTLSSYSFGNRNSGIKYYIHQFLGKWLLKYCHIHATSEYEKQAIIHLVAPKSITVIPNFIYLPEPRNCKDINQECPREKTGTTKLLFLSRIEEKKGLDILFSALAEINTPYSLTIAGTGDAKYVEELKKLASTLNIHSSITWIGQQSQEEKWRVMQDHDLMLLTSHDENFANVVIECLSTGTPVLISNKVGLADYIIEKDFGWVCQLDKESIKKNILLFFSQKEKAIRIKQSAPQQIRTDFDENKLVQSFLKMYSDVVNH